MLSRARRLCRGLQRTPVALAVQKARPMQCRGDDATDGYSSAAVKKATATASIAIKTFLL